MKRLALLAIFMSAVGASAAVSAVNPPNPNSADFIYVSASTPYQELLPQPVVINGSQIELTFRGYAVLPAGGGATFAVGRLPAGTYTIIVRHVFEEESGNPALILTDPPYTLVVAAAHFVPALDPIGLALLVAAVAITGVFVIRRL